MDLGIAGKRALVCASSKGLGRGCAEALADAGVDRVMNARGAEALEAAAHDLRARYQVQVAIDTLLGAREGVQASREEMVALRDATGVIDDVVSVISESLPFGSSAW